MHRYSNEKYRNHYANGMHADEEMLCHIIHYDNRDKTIILWMNEGQWTIIATFAPMRPNQVA